MKARIEIYYDEEFDTWTVRKAELSHYAAVWSVHTETVGMTEDEALEEVRELMHTMFPA